MPDTPTMRVEEDEALVPDCPRCGAALDVARTREVTATGKAATRFGKRYAYACPACNALLGISHRKGFRMG